MARACPSPLDCATTYGELTVGGQTLHRQAWCAVDLSELFDSPEVRGENVLVEDTAGRSARPMLDDETDYSLPLVFSGAVDEAGVEHADPFAGLFANRQAFVGHYIEPVRAGTPTLSATIDLPGGTSMVADVQPLHLEWRLVPGGYARGVLVLRVPAGGFVESY